MNSAENRTGTERIPKNGESHMLGDAVWAQAKSDYITGNESQAELAARLGVTKSAVEKHANCRHPANLGVSWDAARSDFLRRKGAAAEAHGVRSGTRVLGDLRDRSAGIALLALAEIDRRFKRDAAAIETKDLIGVAKLAMTLRVELAGDPDGNPVRIERTLDQLTIRAEPVE